MFVVTLSKTSLKKLGAGAACCALVVFSAMLGRFISTRTVAVAAPVNRIESAQDIQTWFTGYGLEVDGASITADKVKIPRRWDDSFSAFNGVVQQSGMDLARYKGKTVEKWSALLPAASNGETSRYGVLLVYKKEGRGRVSAGKTFRHGAGAAGRSERTGKADFRRGLQRRLGRAARRAADRQHRAADLRRTGGRTRSRPAGSPLHRAAAGRRRVSRGIGTALLKKRPF